mgnify:CR=1 FL=1
MFGRRWNYDLLKKVKDMFVVVWVKDIFITLGLLLLVFSLWIPPIVYEVITASLLSLCLSPTIKAKIRRSLRIMENLGRW